MADVFVLRLKKNYEPILRDLEPRQVLNYLYQEDVIDDDLRDEIRAERTRKRQAEILLDSLRRRGPEAIEQFITGLQNSSQKHLAEILKKPLPDESTGIFHSPDGHDIYPMNHNPSGRALIISNAVFDDNTKLKYREGSEQDVLCMKRLFGGLQFIVTVLRNRTAGQMKTAVRALALEDHTKYDCCMLFFMSHGNEKGIYGTDGKVISYTEITGFFKGEYSPTLANKPKLFFVQACRGNKTDVGVDVLESPVEGSIPPANLHTNASESRPISFVIPSNADIYFAFASSPRCAALRNTQNGGWFVSQLYEVMTQYAGQEDLMTMMLRVTRNVAEMGSSSMPNAKQCPQQCTQLRKKLFFRPKNVLQ